LSFPSANHISTPHSDYYKSIAEEIIFRLTTQAVNEGGKSVSCS
jgi:hypothetical protein